MEKPTKGVSVDGGTIGNPGPCFYQGVDIETGEQLFHEELGEGTNNIAEFLGAVHAIHYCKVNNLDTEIWSDSKTAMAWVRNKKFNTSFDGDVVKRMDKAVAYLNKIDIPVINKWKTKLWGEIPADFGRK